MSENIEATDGQPSSSSASIGARGRKLLLLVAIAGAGALAIWSVQSRVPGKSKKVVEPLFSDFVGSQACAACHVEEYDVWKRSTHAHAGGDVSEVKIIARFDGKPLQFKDAVVTPLVNPLGEHIFRVQPQGRPGFEIRVDYTVGGGRMYGGGTQAFFGKFPDGTLRFLPFDFIRRENLWFVQRKDLTWVPISEEISLLSDLQHWPPHTVLGHTSKHFNCQSCHGSQISVVESETPGILKTRFTTLAINCESCHGAGRRHIEIVSKPGFEQLEDIGMVPLATLSKDESLMVCFRCHGIKVILRSDCYFPGPGNSLDEYMSLKMPLVEGGRFEVDGRIRKFGYQANHLFSDCYLSGSMTCVDCHDPHSQDYRDVFFKPLSGRFDNGQCTGCHASKAVNSEAHSHHAKGSSGNLCTSCHMPYLQHRLLGKKLRFARSDHTIPIPRPEFDSHLGIENACGQCHKDKKTDWLQAKVDSWYGEIKPHPVAVANLIKAGNSKNPDVAKRLLLNPDATHPMAQMKGLSAYLRRVLRPDDKHPDREVIEKLMAFAEKDDVDLQALGLLGLDVGFGNDDYVKRFLAKQLANLGDKEVAVRQRWGTAGDRLGSLLLRKKRYRTALKWMQSGEAVLPDDPAIKARLALVHMLLGESARAVEIQQEAIELNPDDAAMHIQLGRYYFGMGEAEPAKAALEEGLRHGPGGQDAAQAQQMLATLRSRRRSR